MALGYNVIVGAKGGRLDLLLNTVYYLNRPIENIPWDYYKEFLHASELRRWQGRANMPTDVDMAIPVCLGDVVGEAGQYRVVGHDAGNVQRAVALRSFPSGEFQTRRFHDSAVIGAEVAEQMDLKVGDSFSPAHGVGGEKHMPFKIVGIVDRTGTPNDRAAFVNMEGFFLIPDHAKGHVEEEHKPGERRKPEDEVLKQAVAGRSARGDGGADSHGQHWRRPPELMAPDLVKHVNKEFVAQAIEPIREITRAEQYVRRAGASGAAGADGVDRDCGGGRDFGEHLQLDVGAAARDCGDASVGGRAGNRDDDRAVWSRFCCHWGAGCWVGWPGICLSGRPGR